MIKTQYTEGSYTNLTAEGITDFPLSVPNPSLIVVKHSGTNGASVKAIRYDGSVDVKDMYLIGTTVSVTATDTGITIGMLEGNHSLNIETIN